MKQNENVGEFDANCKRGVRHRTNALLMKSAYYYLMATWEIYNWLAYQDNISIPVPKKLCRTKNSPLHFPVLKRNICFIYILNVHKNKTFYEYLSTRFFNPNNYRTKNFCLRNNFQQTKKIDTDSLVLAARQCIRCTRPFSFFSHSFSCGIDENIFLLIPDVYHLHRIRNPTIFNIETSNIFQFIHMQSVCPIHIFPLIFSF